MNLRATYLAVLLCLAIPQAILAADAASDHNFSASWLRLGRPSRVFWLYGAAVGQQLLLEELPTSKDKALQNRLPADKADVLSDIMVQLYNDPENSYIPWKYMAVVANMKINGHPEAAIRARLELLRQYAAHELSKLRDAK